MRKESEGVFILSSYVAKLRRGEKKLSEQQFVLDINLLVEVGNIGNFGDKDVFHRQSQSHVTLLSGKKCSWILV